ncbi:MAG: LPS export ABC transporter periplasmic protein LptC [Betaproteobacteria bacterium]|nr:LPS export ABC transporter periplasmic protein LptC [Betaproteobacteria bacterium]
MRAQNMAATLFPLLVLSGLAALAFWLKEAITMPFQAEEGKKLDTPDAIVENLTLYRYDMNGTLRYRMTASRMEHYPSDDNSLILTPRLIHYRPKLPDVTLTAQSAFVTEKGERVLLRDDVVLTRAAYAGRAALVARTPELTVLPEEGKAFNDKPVAITQGATWLNGIGLLADHDLGTFTLRRKARGEYVQAPSAKKP